MPSNNTSPARSQGANLTPRKLRSRRTLSMGSPARSNVSGRLTSIVDDARKNRGSFVLSPLSNRKSILTDNTFIDKPGRASWWKKLGDNSRDVIEVLNSNEAVDPNNVIEDYVDVLSQEKKNYTLDLPESSDNESINSIVVPQKRLFTKQSIQNKNNYDKIIGSRDTLAKINKTNNDLHDNSVKVATKNLFNQAPKRTRPAFPEALLTISPNKTVANKTKEIVTAEVKGQVKTLFGNRPGTKRKNMFVDFIVSESEDEIPDIQPRVFGFPKKPDVSRRPSCASLGTREPSPTSSINTDIDMDDWKLLPSSTMVVNQIEEMMTATTPVKKPRLSKLSEDKESGNGTNVTANKTKLTNKLLISYNSKDVLKASSTEVNKLEEQTKESSAEEEVDETGQNDALMELFEEDEEPSAHESEEGNESDNDQDEQNNTGYNEQDDGEDESSISKQLTANEEETPSLEKNEVSAANTSHDTTGRHRTKKDFAKSPEAILQNMSNKDQSFTMKGRNTSIRKSHFTKIEEMMTATTPVKKSRLSKLSEDKESDNGTNVTANKARLTNISLISYNSKNVLKASSTEVNKLEKQTKESSAEEEVDETGQNDASMELFEEGEEPSAHESEVGNESDNDQDEQNNTGYNEQDDGEDESSISKQLPSNEEETPSLEKNEVSAANTSHDTTGRHRTKKDFAKSPEAILQNMSNKDQSFTMKGRNTSIRKSHFTKIEEIMTATTPVKKSRLSKLSEDKESENGTNVTANKARLTNISLISYNSKNVLKASSTEVNKLEEQTKESSAEEEVDETGQNDASMELFEAGEEPSAHESEEGNESDNDQDEQNNTGYNEKDDGEDESSISKQLTSNEEETPSLEKNEVSAANTSHDTTGRHRTKKDFAKSPEAILQNMSNKDQSFTMKGRNTSIRKTKSMIKQLSIKPSLAPVRDSTGFSDGTKNSSAEGSGWDSHRTTRKTIRQTMGKDFSPRKSLRALVMEKSAKRYTVMSEWNDNQIRVPQANSTQYPEPMVINEDEENYSSDAPTSNHEVSKRTRQATLEMYLQSVKMKNQQQRLQIEEEVKYSLKNPSNENVNFFKLPSKSGFSLKHKINSKGQQNKPKSKVIKSTIIPLEDLPVNLLEDMKYKPPKRYKPGNASWITKRLYNFFESKLEAKYDYKARIRAEKLVETIYTFTKDLRRHPVAPKDATAMLKREMARLNIVQSHFDFYNFFHEYMPREVRVKVVPDLVNKISLPKHGVFADILT